MSSIHFTKFAIIRKNSLRDYVLTRISGINRVLFHPVFVFVVLQIVCVALTVIIVIWYTSKDRLDIAGNIDLVFLIIGCVLTGITLVGTVLLFVFAIKQSRQNKQQRTFVSSVTHELRSPIASMQLSLETLKARELSPDIVKRMQDMMLADLDRLVKLVDQILVSARLDRGIKIFEQIESFAIRSVLESALENAAHLDGKIQERVKIHCPEGLHIHSSKPAVSLVVGNLIENAIKYSPQTSPIVIDVKIDHENIVLSVKDQGFGLDKSETKRIFKVFHRGKVASKKAISGTGLGLYIVRTVVKVLGGKVWAESPGIGQGSTFFVALPVEATPL